MIALALSLTMGVSSAAPNAIGTVLAHGSFRVDRSTVTGNATLFEGSLLETATAVSVQLNSGAVVSLGQDSRSRLFGDRMVLEKGTTQLEHSTGLRLIALGLTVLPDRSDSQASVTLEGTRRVRVANSRGALRVLNASGQVIANMPAGTALSFEPQQGPASVARITGCVEQKSGHYLVTDEVTNVTVEITGSTISKELGNKVEVTGATDPGATPSNDAAQLVRAREIRHLAQGCNVGSGAPAAAGAARGAGLGSTGTVIAVIGGVAAAAAVGGLAAADALPGQSSNPSSR
jgi:hypothetical protein